MLSQIQLVRNVGLFDSVALGAQSPLTRFTLIYAENGRGKTTLAAILRSLQDASPQPVIERTRLGAAHPPHIILRHTNGAHTFQNGAWSAALPALAIFDDTFIANNVCSGIEIGTEQRQNLHELILGAEGVALNTQLQTLVTKIEQHNRDIRTKENAIPLVDRHGLSADDFCALQEDPDVAEHIRETTEALAAAKEAAAVEAGDIFTELALPPLETELVDRILATDLPQLDAISAAQVQAHIEKLGNGAEQWLANGLTRIDRASAGMGSETCPFCTQSITDIDLVKHYRAYFGQAYTDLKTSVDAALRTLEANHYGQIPASFERSIRLAADRRQFWSKFTPVSELAIDTAGIAIIWNSAKDGLRDALRRKQQSPLEKIELSEEVRDSVREYAATQRSVKEKSDALTSTNVAIAAVKEKARGANVAMLNSDLTRLKATQARYKAETSQLCKAYCDEKAAKANTEALRAQARAELDNYRQNIFPRYQDAINTYLQRLNADFRISGVAPVNNRSGSSVSYTVMIDNHQVNLAPGLGPSFRNTLSAGDRNTLALAFFFASLEHDQDLANKIVVVDDPMTSLDEGRTLVTIQELRRLSDRVSQIIVLSHSKPFLVGTWKDAPSNSRTALRITRAAVGSTIGEWDVNQDSITEHDRRFARAAAYLGAGDPAIERQVASDLRPMLEALMRVTHPVEFPPGSLLGQFLNTSRQRVGTPSEILDAADNQELDDLLTYANRFHHDTNQAWQVEHINDHELRHFIDRTLRFIRRH